MKRSGMANKQNSAANGGEIVGQGGGGETSSGGCGRDEEQGGTVKRQAAWLIGQDRTEDLAADWFLGWDKQRTGRTGVSVGMLEKPAGKSLQVGQKG